MVLGHTVRLHTVWQAVLDFGFVFVGVIIAVLWMHNDLPVNIATVAVYAILLGLTMLALNAWVGMYQRIHSRSVQDSRARAVLCLHLSVPVAYLLLVILPDAQINRHMLEITGMTAVFGMLANRIRSQHNRSRNMVRHRVLIIGVGAEAKGVADSLGADDPTLEITGFYPGHPTEEVSVNPDQVLTRDMSLTDTAIALRVDEIIVAVRERRGGVLPLRELLDCRISGIKVMDLSSHFESMLGQIRIDALKAGWLIFGEGFNQGVIRTSIKRAFDCLSALILLILCAPLMLITALLIKLEDGGPVLYKQERVGFNGRLFNVVKFRSMRNDAESDGKPRWASANDDRVTRMGRIIRKVRIDELPPTSPHHQ